MKRTNFRLSEGDQNAGTVYLPDHPAGPMPVMIYCHGWGGDRTLSAFPQELCSRLTDAGMALVTFDFYGCGETGGPYDQMTYGRWTENLAAVHEWVERQPWADSARIGTLGISSGTTAALRHALGRPGSAFVISIATCLGLYINMPRSPARTFVENAEAMLVGERRNVFDIAFPEAFFRDFVEGAPVFTVASIECPVFFLQGTNDDPFRRSDAWLGKELRRTAGRPVAYREIEGGDHGMGKKAEEGASAVLDWLIDIGVLRR